MDKKYFEIFQQNNSIIIEVQLLENNGKFGQ